MKLKILQENLSTALQITSRFASIHAQLPVLSNVLLKTDKNKLNLISTNLENSVSITVGAKVETDGEITVPAKTMFDLVSNLTSETLELTVDKENLTIASSTSTSTLLGMNASDFPSVPTKVFSGGVVLSAKAVKEVVPQILFAVSSDETRPTLTGLLIDPGDSGLLLVATDGFRLSKKTIKGVTSTIKDKIILPKNTIVELMRLIDGIDSITLSYNSTDRQVVFGCGDVILSSRVIEGDYPPYEKIIPANSPISVNLDREDLLRAVKLASVFARTASNVIKLHVLPKSIKILSESSASGSGQSEVEAKVEGNEIKEEGESLLIAFNYRFLEEFLTSIKGDGVKIGLNNPDAPGVFTDPSDPDFLHLIMPVRLQN